MNEHWFVIKGNTTNPQWVADELQKLIDDHGPFVGMNLKAVGGIPVVSSSEGRSSPKGEKSPTQGRR